MPSFAITVVLTYLTDYYLRLMAKRSTNYPASRISILQQRRNSLLTKVILISVNYYQFKYNRKAQTSCLLLKN